MTSTIKTAIRVRPFLKSEIEQGYRNHKLVLHPERSEVALADPSVQKNYKCDHLITP